MQFGGQSVCFSVSMVFSRFGPPIILLSFMYLIFINFSVITMIEVPI